MIRPGCFRASLAAIGCARPASESPTTRKSVVQRSRMAAGRIEKRALRRRARKKCRPVYGFFASRTAGGPLSVKITISSPVTVLMS